MRTILIIILTSLLFLNCSQNKKLEGFWLSVTKNSRYPILLKFENDILIDYSAFPDSLRYKYSNEKLYLTNQFSEKNNIRINLTKTELTLLNQTSDSILSQFKKKSSNYIIQDILNNKSLKIDIPLGNGIERKYQEIYSSSKPLFISYHNDSLIAYYGNLKKSIKKDFYKTLKGDLTNQLTDIRRFKISIIADRNIKIKDFEIIKKQIKLAGYNSVEFILQNNNYDVIKSFQLRLPPLSNKDLKEYEINLKEYILPPAPLKFDKEDNLLIEIGRNNVKINGELISKNNLKNKIKEKLKTNLDLSISYQYTDTAVYQDYIEILDIYYNSIIDLRKTYLKNKYSIDYFSTNYEHKDKIKESKEKFRFILFSFDNSKHLIK